MGRDSFVFYRSFYEALQNVPKKYRTEVYEAVFEYAFESREPSLSGVPRALWELIRPVLDSAQKRYDNAKKGAEYGKLGGRPRKKGSEKKPLKGFEKKTLNVDKDVDVDVDVDVDAKADAPSGESDTHIPTIEEINRYCTENGIKTDVKKFMQYNEGKGWSMDWKVALKMWAQKDTDRKSQERQKNRFNNFENSQKYDFEAIEGAARKKLMEG